MPSTFAFLDDVPEGPPERLDAVDPRLAALGDLADRGAWEEAAERVQELLDARIFDVRPLSYLFYARFHRDGLPALGNLFDAVEAMAGARFASIGPPKKREHHFDKRLTWLFEKVLETLEYHEHKRTPEWVEWHKNLDAALIKRAIVSGETVAGRLAEISAFAEAPRALGALLGWLRGHVELLTAPPKKKTEPPPSPAEKKPSSSNGEADEDPAEEAALASLQRRVDLAVSHRFTMLMSNLRSFETLVAKGDFVKAAVVADEVNRVVGAFDPRDYFPELFAKFSALFSQHVEPLTEQIEQRESPAWKALEQFYRVDPKSFVDG